MANAFNHGDVVVLKSGGPPMTVDRVPAEDGLGAYADEYLCVWFKGASRETGHFNEHALQVYTPPKK